MKGSDEKRVGIGTGVLIFNKGKVLLGKRYVGETWCMPGGKLDFGESFEACAKRETLEETGLILKEIEVICINNDFAEVTHFVTIGFLCKDSFQGEPKAMEPDKITDWQWFDLDNLPSPLYPSSARILDNYLKQKFYISR